MAGVRWRWKRRTALESATISADAQATIKRMAAEEPDLGQMYIRYAIQARRHIATLRRGRPDVVSLVSTESAAGDWKEEESVVQDPRPLRR